jgi:hypothetical protein
MLHEVKRRMDAAARHLASLKLAIALVVALVAAVVVATVLATKHGREYSQWFVYHTMWFVALLIAISMSVFSAAYVRYPWKRHQTGFVITHAGLLMLLIGSLLTIWRGMQGQLVVAEGASSDSFLLDGRSQVTAHWVDRPQDPAYVFTFESGPADWKPGTTLDLGNIDGVRMDVLRYYHRSEPVERWVADEAGQGGPLVRFQMKGPKGVERVEHFLADRDYGAELFVGPVAVRLQRAISDAMVADFLEPRNSELGERGTLTVYYQDEVERASVDQSIGQTIDVGDSGAKVELVHYFENAKLDAGGQFRPVGEDLRNPLVELKVSLPGDDQFYRQVAFAKSPLLNFDGVYERTCPVKFVYEHPKIERGTAIEFLQGGDGKLFARSVSGGRCTPHRALTAGSRIELDGGFVFQIAEYLPNARREISFRPAKSTSAGRRGRELPAAAEVKLERAGATKHLWLQRNHPEFQFGTIDVPDGPLRVQFTTAEVPLGFSLELLDVQREIDPNRVGSDRCSSLVRVSDPERGIQEERLITMIEPLSYGGFRFYQAPCREAAHGKEISTIRVVYDPGRRLKSWGSLVVCLGVAAIICMRACSRPWADAS